MAARIGVLPRELMLGFAHPIRVRARMLQSVWLVRLLWLLVFALAVIGISNRAAGDVLIVRASDAGPYKEAESALSGKLSSRKEAVSSLTLKQLQELGLSSHVKAGDCVVAIGTPAARWLQTQVPASVRLVYCMVNNPADAGLLSGHESFGVSTDVSIEAQINLMNEALPKARTIGMLYRSDTPEGRELVKQVTAALPSDWHLETVAVNEQPSVGQAIDVLTSKPIDLVWTSADGNLYDAASIRTLLLSGIRKGVPVWGFSPGFVRAGALIGVGVDARSQGEQAADLLLQLIDRPGTVKVRAASPRQFQIAINLIVAQKLSIDLPEELCGRATYLFKPE